MSPPGREHQRVPFQVRVQYRNASSLLVAYSLNLSRGGIFLETTQELGIGTDIALSLEVPGIGPVEVAGRVHWRREQPDADGPAGVGVEFHELNEVLTGLIDDLALGFTRGDFSLTILLLCSDERAASSHRRVLKSIIGAANVVVAPSGAVATTLLEDEIDLLVVDGDAGDPGLGAVQAAARRNLPAVVMTNSPAIRDAAHRAGAAAVVANPPPLEELRRVVVSTLGRPALIEG